MSSEPRSTPAPLPVKIVPRASEADIDAECKADRVHRKPHPDRKTFMICSADYEHSKVSRIGITVEDVVADELAEHAAGLAWEMAHLGGPGRDTEEDRCVWGVEEGVYRLRAVIRFNASDPANPIVHVFEE